MSARLFKILYKIHIYVGIFVAVHLFVLILTGTVLILKDEIEGNAGHGEEHHAEVVPAMDVHLEKILQKYSGDRPQSFNIEEADHDVAQLRMGHNGAKLFRESHRVYFNVHTGEEVSAPKKTDGVMDFILRLHREFLLGSNGKLYVGLIGVLYAFTLISGFFIYGNFARKTNFGEVRRGSTRATMGDLHRFIGMTAFAWSLMIGVTGSFLGFSSTLIKVFQYSELQKLNVQYPTAPQAPLASVDKVIASAQKALPESTFDFMVFPDTQFSPPGHFMVLMHGNTPMTERLVDLVIIDGVTGELTEVRELPWYLKVAMLSEPLHFGNYGGLFLKILWVILSVASLVMPVSGIYIWWNRRRKKAPAPATKATSVQPWKGALFKKIYTVPVILSAFSTAAVIGSFLVQGALNTVFVAALVVPVSIVVYFLISWLKKGAQ
ncbi:PepSY-associated TM helix domain-containing protein [Bdellovibrio bacteriovorus]|uniref:PepSY-associated TM helix domain-containing protein n=1 Tax=Bdellovibrio bacteriovorus TaxID=959 RepID=UPI0035A6A2F0